MMSPLPLVQCAVLLLPLLSGSFHVPKGPPDRPQLQARDTLYTFREDVVPLLKSSCSPCHFPGGKMYGKLPFDDSTTVVALGDKLTGRLKKDGQETIVRRWMETAEEKRSGEP